MISHEKVRAIHLRVREYPDSLEMIPTKQTKPEFLSASLHRLLVHPGPLSNASSFFESSCVTLLIATQLKKEVAKDLSNYYTSW